MGDVAEATALPTDARGGAEGLGPAPAGAATTETARTRAMIAIADLCGPPTDTYPSYRRPAWSSCSHHIGMGRVGPHPAFGRRHRY